MYDDDGNLLSDGKWNYAWDGENRLIAIQSLSSIPDAAKHRMEYSYDCQGRRIYAKQMVWTNSVYRLADEERYWYDGWNLIGRANLTGLVQTYCWGLDLSGSMQGAGGVGGLLWLTSQSMINSQPATYFYGYDGNGNVKALFGATDGTTVATYEYGPFGELLRGDGAMATLNPIRFSTKFQDDETKLLYYGYRYYNPNTGRWSGRDPIEERGGSNLYGFVHGEPTGYTDPVGFQSWIGPGYGVPGLPSGVVNGPIGPSNQVGNPVDMFLFYFFNRGHAAVLSPQLMDSVVNSEELKDFQSNLKTSAELLMCKTPCGQKGRYVISPLDDDEYYPFSAFFTGKWQLSALGEVIWESKIDGLGGCVYFARGSIKGFVSKAYMFERILGANPRNWVTTYVAPFPSIAYPFGGGPYSIIGDFNIDFDFAHDCACK